MKKAFTLIEMVIVIIMIGILAAIVIPNQTAYIDQAKEAAADAAYRGFQNSVMLGIAQDARDASNQQVFTASDGTTTYTFQTTPTSDANCLTMFVAYTDVASSGSVNEWTASWGTPTCTYSRPNEAAAFFTYNTTTHAVAKS